MTSIFIVTVLLILFSNLNYLKNYTGDAQELALDFTTAESIFGETKFIELKPGGKNIPVSNENKLEYIHLIANYKLNRQIFAQTKAFMTGLDDVVSLDWLRIFDPIELQTLISGADLMIDVEDLRKHTQFIASSDPDGKTSVDFWNIMRGFSESQRRSLLRFVTGCSRPPMFGFQHLFPPFSIQIVPDLDRLPTSSTCMNLLKLPDFKNEEVLLEKLLYSINSNAGFEYS